MPTHTETELGAASPRVTDLTTPETGASGPNLPDLTNGVVLNVDDVATYMRFESPLIEVRRRLVYDLVRQGLLRPIGGAPEPGRKLTKRLRFSAKSVRELLEVAS